jgi:hypothetical protein
MREFPNYMNKVLFQNEAFNLSISQCLFDIVSNAKGDCVTYENEKQQRKAVVLKDTQSNKDYYLFYLNNGLISVYHDMDYSWQERPFSYAYSSMQKDKGEIYISDFILSARRVTKKEKNKTGNNKFLNMNFSDLLQHLKEITQDKAGEIGEDVKTMLLEALDNTATIKRSGLNEINVYGYDIKKFTDFLFHHGYINKAIDENIYLNVGYDCAPEINEHVTDILVKLDYLLEQAKNHGFNSKNKLAFNDSDNHFWVQSGLVCFDGQNLGYVAKKQEKDNWIIYNYSQPGYRSFTTANEVIKAIKNDDINWLRDVAMVIKNGHITYFNNGDLDIMNFQLKHTVNVVQEETQEKPEYDIDLCSYEYQAAWHQVRYGMNEIQFLVQAMLTLGGGFDYDSERGIFYSNNVDYDAQAHELSQRYYEQPRDTHTKQINYCYSDKFSDICYLDKSWLAGMKLLVETLEINNPNVIASHDSQEDIKAAIKSGQTLIKQLEEHQKKNRHTF